MVTAAFARTTMTVSMTSMPDWARPTGGLSLAASAPPTASPGPPGSSPRGRRAACGTACPLAVAGLPSTRDQARLAAASGAESGLVLTHRVKRMAEKIMAVCSTTTVGASSATVGGGVARRARGGSAYWVQETLSSPSGP